MGIKVKITNDEAEGHEGRLAVTVVTVGNLEAPEHKHVLGGQQSVTVQVHEGQFVMVDETDKEQG